MKAVKKFGCRWWSLPILGAVLASAAAAQPSPEVFTPYHVAKLASVVEAVISPDGSQVAYVLQVPRKPFAEEDGPAWTELHVVDLEGNSRPYVTGKVNVASVTWTPDGRGISFLAKRGGDKEKSLYVIPVGGGEARKVLGWETEIEGYSWSPDGRQVAFLAKPAKPEQIQELEKKGFNQEVYEEDIRPVRIGVALLGEEGKKPRVLEVEGSASELHWSPSGRHLAVALAPTSLIDDHYMRRQVHILDAESGRVVRKLEARGKMGALRWSPDGSFLALISGEDLHDPAEGRLLVASLEEGKWKDILPGYAGHVEALAWKDADTLVFVGDEGVWSTVNQIRRDGSRREVLRGAGGPILSHLSLSRDGMKSAFVGETARHPGEVYAGEGSLRRLTDSNPWLSGMRFAEQEVITWRARDGLELEGILVKPLDYRPGVRYPLILSVHGGPESHDSNGWVTSYSRPGQVGAAQGFAVLYPNYRGSTGRGVKFSRLSQGDPAGKEFDDLVDAVDYLVETGLVNRDRVGITGGSYGGYASAWAATYYSERFAASVMFVGISDKISKAGTSDIPWELYLVHDPHWPWDNWEHFLKASPIYHVEKAGTPLLILHGKEDPRVHPGQSMELYRFLKVRNQAPVRLVFYPGEKHGNRRAASRLDYNLRLMRWMSYYLQGPGGDPPPYTLEYDADFFKSPQPERNLRPLAPKSG